MKKILLLLIVQIITINATSQIKYHYGVGVNYTTIPDLSLYEGDFDPQFSYSLSFGIIETYKILGFTADILYNNLATHVKSIEMSPSHRYAYYYDLKLGYLGFNPSISLLLFEKKLDLNAGYYLSTLINSSMHGIFDREPPSGMRDTLILNGNAKKFYKSKDDGITCSIGYTFTINQKFIITPRLKYFYGLKNIGHDFLRFQDLNIRAFCFVIEISVIK